MLTRKHRLSDSGAHTSSPPKKPIINKVVTAEVHRRFETLYQVEFSFNQFTGLCAYLCVLLRWGYCIATPDLDGFIYQYTRFASALANMEQHAITTDSSIPAYHQWYQRHKSPNPAPQRILDEPLLRDVWRENPWTFLLTQCSMEAIVKLRVQHFSTGTPEQSTS
jgi:hypothetical protein